MISLWACYANQAMRAGQAVALHDRRCYPVDDESVAEGHIRHNCLDGDLVLVYPGARYALDDEHAIRSFVDWLYDVAPEWPDMMPREDLLELYRQHVELQARGRG